jgi:hypothetical protein
MALEDFSKYTKITVNPALPKNEKDLICALLAGRLRNLFNGKLFCLDLAIGDLIKDASGYGLTDLVAGLNGLKGSLNDLKNEVGYDKILGSINQALGGIGTVFSLGGLCPSPIRPPQIPDVMPMVNAQLFGQGMNIINALGKVANPKMCFGGGPGGFGVNYNSMPGALSQLKNALNRAANDPAGLNSIANSFANNLKMQERRLNAEVNRLKTNLSDPFGIQQAKQTAATLKAINNRGADYKVVDNKGIQHTNAIKSLVPSDTLSLMNVMDTTPILYKREAVLNYCGEEVGIKMTPVSGDMSYAGWDTNPATDNSDRPFGQHVLPVADYAYYDFVIVETNSTIYAYKYNADTKNLDPIQTIDVKRGIAYRFKISLKTTKMSIVDPANNNAVWSNGIEFGFQGPAGHEVIEVGSGLRYGELDWSVLIENPQTPSNLTLSFTNGTTIPVNVGLYRDNGSGVEAGLLPSERSYNLANIVNKAVFFQTESIDSNNVPVTSTKTDAIFNSETTFITPTTTYTSTQSLSYGTGTNNYQYIDDPDSDDVLDKVLVLTSKVGTVNYTQKIYVNELSGISIKKIVMSLNTRHSTVELNDPLTITSDTKLPYKDYYSYRMYLVNTPNVYSDQTEFDLLDDTTIRWYLTSQRSGQVASGNIMVYYDIDITDQSAPYVKAAKLEFVQGSYSFSINLTKSN